jgi:hypothetical protein
MQERSLSYSSESNTERSDLENGQRFQFTIQVKASAVLISSFRRHVDEICALLGCYAASCGNCLPTFRYNVSVPSS